MPLPPITLTPDTTPVTSLDDGGRFEARRYDNKDGAIDVVRYAANGTIVEKHTFTWSDDYVLFEAKLSRVSSEELELEISAEHWKACTPYEQTFRFRSADEVERKTRERLTEAEQKARESGKEAFDLRRLEALLNRGSQARRERDHRVRYYLLCPELLTLADYARLLLDEEPWEDAP